MNNLQTLKAEVENIIVGQLIDGKHITKIMDNLSEEDFENGLTKAIYKAVAVLVDNGNEVSLPSIYAEAKKVNRDIEISYLSTITSTFFCLKDIYYYIKRLKDLNERIEVVNKLLNGVIEVEDLTKDTDEIKVEISTSLENDIKTESKGVTIENATEEFFEMIERYMTNKNTDMLYQVPTLDRETGGFSEAQLITVGARSGVGKTSFVINIVDKVAQSRKVLFISREMKKGQLISKLISRYTGIGLVEMKRGLSDEQYRTVIQATGEANEKFKNLIIDDYSSSIKDIKVAIKRYKPDLVVIDYLQLLDPVNAKENRERQVATLSREIKKMTMAFNIPIIQLTQLNSENGDSRPVGETPMRESKAIYHDSNVVIYLHRPNDKEMEYIFKNYDVSESKMEMFKTSGYRLIEVCLDKQREGNTGLVVRTWFNGKKSTYGEISKIIK